MSRNRVPKFQIDEPDFDPRLIPVSHHAGFLGLSRRQQLAVSTAYACGWIQDTVELETRVLSEACGAVIGTAGVPNDVKKHIAHVASEDEGRHVTDAVQQLCETREKRQQRSPVPRGRFLQLYQRHVKSLEPRERQVFGLAVASVVEVNQGALHKLAESDSINAFQRHFHARHWRDEQTHVEAFRALAPVVFPALSPEEQRTFVEGIKRAAWWIGAFDRNFATHALLATGLPASKAISIAGEVARETVPAPDPAADWLLAAIGVPATVLLDAPLEPSS